MCGDPGDPLSYEEIIAKFRANTEGTLSHERADEITTATCEIDPPENIKKYLSLFIV